MTSGVFVTDARFLVDQCPGWVDEDMETECPFEFGFVDGWIDTESGMRGWECPTCGTEFAEPIR